jgi:hypothetical protein
MADTSPLTVEEIDLADHKLSSYVADLDAFLAAARHDVGTDASLEDAAFMHRAGIASDAAESAIEDEAFRRLLVHASETIDVAETIKRDAENLRDLLVRLYRDATIDAPASVVRHYERLQEWHAEQAQRLQEWHSEQSRVGS